MATIIEMLVMGNNFEIRSGILETPGLANACGEFSLSNGQYPAECVNY